MEVIVRIAFGFHLGVIFFVTLCVVFAVGRKMQLLGLAILLASLPFVFEIFLREPEELA